MAAALADGTTVLRNCALEPEVADLVALLREMGADISGPEGETIVVRGRASLHGAGHRVIPDRIEAGTYLIAGCFAGNEIEVQGVVPEHLRSLLDILAGMGAAVTVSASSAFHVKGGAPLGPGRGGHRALSRLSHRPAGPADHAADPGRRGLAGAGRPSSTTASAMWAN